MGKKLIGYSAVFKSNSGDMDLFISHEPESANWYGRIWPRLMEATSVVHRSKLRPDMRLVAVYEIEVRIPKYLAADSYLI